MFRLKGWKSYARRLDKQNKKKTRLGNFKSYIFVSPTPGSELKKIMQAKEIEMRPGGRDNWGIKTIETAGQTLENVLVKSDPFNGNKCLDKKCIANKNIKNHIPRVVFDLPSILGGNQRVARHLTRHLSGTIFWRPPAASNLTTRLRLLTWPFELAKLLTFHFSHFKGHFWAFPSGSKCRHRPISVILPVCNSAHGSMAHFTPPATILAPAPCL